MSLRFRLNLFITVLFALILLGGSIFVITNARKAVSEEVQATASLTLQLIEIIFANTDYEDPGVMGYKVLNRINNLDSIRHLDIHLYRKDSNESGLVPGSVNITADAPGWFIRLVKPPLIEYHRSLGIENQPLMEVLIRANPSDEITEAWGETRNILGILFLFALLANFLVYFTLGRDLAPIENIVNGLGGIERGNFRFRLPEFKLPELARISERFNLMAEVLERSQEENKVLTQRSLVIQENERRHLAHELHDEMGQSITAIKAVAASISQQADADSESVTESANIIIKVSNRMYDVARNMMRRLRPAVMDELGLIAALQDMIDDWNERHQEVFCSFSFDGELANLGEEINIGIYRVIQESLTNTIKHSEASTVEIKITSINKQEYDTNNEQFVDLSIKDNGKGFDTSKTRWGLGLLGIRERVQILNGEFLLTSAIGEGVNIQIKIPVNAFVKKGEYDK